MSIESLEIKAKDGFALSLSYFSAEAEQIKNAPVIAIHPAVGVKKSFYSPLAKFLSGNGFHVFTIDYRGIGDSGDPKAVDDGLHTWGTLDLAALHNHIENKFPNSPLHIIGHSGGGWLIGFLQPPKNLKSLILLNVGDGYFNSFPFPQNIMMYLTWKFLIPREVSKHGVLPTSSRYYGLPLPKNVALEWSDYGLNKNFIEGTSFNPYAKFLSSYQVPTLAYSFTDDNVLGEKSIKSMLSKFTGAKLEHRHLSPKEIGERAMGHFGFLRPNQKKKLWPNLIHWLDQFHIKKKLELVK